jgi:hypothetical protein
MRSELHSVRLYKTPNTEDLGGRLPPHSDGTEISPPRHSLHQSPCSPTHLAPLIISLRQSFRSIHYCPPPLSCFINYFAPQSFHFPTQIAPPPTEIWLMNSRSRCTCDNPDPGFWHVNLGRERIRALQCRPMKGKSSEVGFATIGFKESD